ncbi:MAG: HD domain-containing protein [Candidatus Omnitrophica bacterium]|nr:HD domain-containing protein [Candidatus Omnitrophota bacterium]
METVALEDIKNHPQTAAFLKKADEHMKAIGYTEHGFRHANIVSKAAAAILEELGYKKRVVELGAISGYLHDIGNVTGRYDHGQVSGMIAKDILLDLGMPPLEVAVIIGALGNHEEPDADPINEVCASLIIADKADVHRSRVRNRRMISFDIHDRVNYAVRRSYIKVDRKARTITLVLKIDTTLSQVMEYFEIFLSRMVISRRAAKFLNCNFNLIANNVKLL